MDYNLTFSSHEDIRLPRSDDSVAVIFEAGGSEHPATELITVNPITGRFLLPAGSLGIGHYSYAIFMQIEGARRIIQSGKLNIYAGGVRLNDDEIEYNLLKEVIQGADHDIKEITFPDGRIVAYTDRIEMRKRADVLKHRIAHGRAGIRWTSIV